MLRIIYKNIRTELKVNFKMPSFFWHIFYPSGKPMIPHLLRCQGFAVVYYSFTLGRLGSTAS